MQVIKIKSENLKDLEKPLKELLPQLNKLIDYQSIIKAENDDTITNYDVSKTMEFFYTISHNRLYVRNSDNKVMNCFKPNNRNNENFFLVKGFL